MKIIRLTEDNRDLYAQQLQELESLPIYPYGDDSFRLHHGRSYYQFFENLGELVFHVAVDKRNQVVGCAAAVLRNLAFRTDAPVGAWYLCDLKVHPNFRGQGVTRKLIRKNLLRNYFRCPRGYLVTMNPSEGTNHVVPLMKTVSPIGFRHETTLRFFQFNYEELGARIPLIEQIVGPISYRSLRGVKDLIMTSSGQPLPLVHIQHGFCAEPNFPGPDKGSTHMICAPIDSPLEQLLRLFASPTATAAVLAHRMSRIDWGFILTSEI